MDDITVKIEADYTKLKNASAAMEKVLETLSGSAKTLGAELKKLAEPFAQLEKAGKDTADGLKEKFDEIGKKLSETFKPQILAKAINVDKELAGVQTMLYLLSSINPAAMIAADKIGTDLRSAIWNTKDATQDWYNDLKKSVDVFGTLKIASNAALGSIGKYFTGLSEAMGAGEKAGAALKDTLWNPNKVTVSKTGDVIKGGFDFSALQGKHGDSAQIGAATNLAVAGVGAAGAIMNATNVKGRGNRALKGAATGAAIGTQILPGWGTAVGAAVGALVGAFRNPAFEDVFNRVAKNFGVKLSDETAKAIADLAKKDFKGDRQAAEIFSIDKIIGEAGGLTDKNVGLLTDRLRDAFSMKETGKFTAEQLTGVLQKNFGTFAEFVTKSKNLASQSFQDLISLNKQFGSESQAIADFVTGQTGKLGTSVAALAGPLTEQFAKLGTSIKETQANITRLTTDGKTGTEEYAVAVTQLAGLQEQWKAGAANAGVEIERLGLIAVGAFNASVAAGTDYVTAVQQMAPALDQLIALQTTLGITTENAALAELQSFSTRVENNQALVMSATALGETMRALASIGGLNSETLAAMEAQGLQTFERLKEAGFSENQALQQMKDFLLNVVQAHTDLKIPLGANTEQLYEMARAQGILKDEGKSTNEILTESFRELKDAVYLVAQALGADVPAAANEARRAIDGIPNTVDVNVNYHANGYPGDGGSADGGGVDGYAKGTGGFRNFGSGTLAMLHGWEAVIPMNQLRGSTGGEGVQINVWLNDDLIGRAAARGLPAMLDVYGATR
jgi:hypothetical protein